MQYAPSSFTTLVLWNFNVHTEFHSFWPVLNGCWFKSFLYMAFYPSHLISRRAGRLLRCGDVTDADDPRSSRHGRRVAALGRRAGNRTHCRRPYARLNADFSARHSGRVARTRHAVLTRRAVVSRLSLVPSAVGLLGSPVFQCSGSLLLVATGAVGTCVCDRVVRLRYSFVCVSVSVCARCVFSTRPDRPRRRVRCVVRVWISPFQLRLVNAVGSVVLRAVLRTGVVVSPRFVFIGVGGAYREFVLVRAPQPADDFAVRRPLIPVRVSQVVSLGSRGHSRVHHMCGSANPLYSVQNIVYVICDLHHRRHPPYRFPQEICTVATTTTVVDLIDPF
ncbi:hypothetical protein QTP88_014985 [Uroleucon formosanum]